jgi:hypothetical protein
LTAKYSRECINTSRSLSDDLKKAGESSTETFEARSGSREGLL